jgi:hypothetical protein
MCEWFFSEFIPPDECTPNMSEEFGTQYVCGGPYFADEVMRKEFSDRFPSGLIEDVIHDLDEEETEWVLKKHFEYH